MATPAVSVGSLLRDWRRRRRFSQLELALEAGVSQRHLSFLESGRATPSREMVLRLAEHLSIPLRERNTLLVAAGFAPFYRERTDDEPDMAAARRAVELILQGHEPHPALAIDRHWTLVSANRALAPLLAGVEARLLQPPVNVLRLSLHPRGVAPRIANFRQWRGHVLARLQQQIDNSGDGVLASLLDELEHYPVPPRAKPFGSSGQEEDLGGIAVPLELETEQGRLLFLSTTTVFGTALDVGLSELAIESFFPADGFTAETMRSLARHEAGRATPPEDALAGPPAPNQQAGCKKGATKKR